MGSDLETEVEKEEACNENLERAPSFRVYEWVGCEPLLSNSVLLVHMLSKLEIE